MSPDGRTETSSSHLRGSAASRLRLSRPDPLPPLSFEERSRSTAWSSGTGSRRVEGANVTHVNAEGMVYVAVNVGRTMKRYHDM